MQHYNKKLSSGIATAVSRETDILLPETDCLGQKLQEKALETALALFDPHYPVRSQHFTLVFYKGTLLSVGRNSKKTHPINLLNHQRSLNYQEKSWVLGNGRVLTPLLPSLKGTCSELAALIKIKRTVNIPFNKLTLVNIRLMRDRTPGLSKPCVYCRSLLEYLGIRRVWYTDDTGHFLPYKR